MKQDYPKISSRKSSSSPVKNSKTKSSTKKSSTKKSSTKKSTSVKRVSSRKVSSAKPSHAKSTFSHAKGLVMKHKTAIGAGLLASSLLGAGYLFNKKFLNQLPPKVGSKYDDDRRQNTRWGYIKELFKGKVKKGKDIIPLAPGNVPQKIFNEPEVKQDKNGNYIDPIYKQDSSGNLLRDKNNRPIPKTIFNYQKNSKTFQEILKERQDKIENTRDAVKESESICMTQEKYKKILDNLTQMMTEEKAKETMKKRYYKIC
jgi:hypothetical protein